MKSFCASVLGWLAWISAFSATGCSETTEFQWVSRVPQAGVFLPHDPDPGTIHEVDLVFVIDNSLSMHDEQDRLRRNFPAMMKALQEMHGGLPDIHLAVMTPDLGTSPYNIPDCERAGGDQGAFFKGFNNSCADPFNQNYLVDVQPRGCSVVREPDGEREGECVSHSCIQANCDQEAFRDSEKGATEPTGLVLSLDEKGCPRCRNYREEDMGKVFSCMASLGTKGCGMEQPLEALYKALTGNHPSTRGFLRKDAFLAIFIITDEDDCSAHNTELFNPIGDINSQMGTLTSFRCMEFGVKCDQNWQRIMPAGSFTYTHCRSREADDPKNMLHPISRYTTLLSRLKNSRKLLVGAITGPFQDSLVVGLDSNQNPTVMPSCGQHPEGASPAVRIAEFVKAIMNRPADRVWALSSICDGDYSHALAGMGNRLRHLMETRCLNTPLLGCPDPAFAFGYPRLTRLPDLQAARCQPECTVQDIHPDGTFTEILQCANDYQQGHPSLRDTDLPVPQCWQVVYDPDCVDPCPAGTLDQGCDPGTNPWNGPARGANVVISRREDPAPGTRSRVLCATFPLTEKLCSDGIDNDFDGLVDLADPDCQK